MSEHTKPAADPLDGWTPNLDNRDDFDPPEGCSADNFATESTAIRLYNLLAPNGATAIIARKWPGEQVLPGAATGIQRTILLRNGVELCAGLLAAFLCRWADRGAAIKEMRRQVQQALNLWGKARD